MKIAIAMRTFRPDTQDFVECVGNDAEECFANFEVQEAFAGNDTQREGEDETVQVTVVLRGRRNELQNPALGVTQLVLGALKAQTTEDGRPRPSSSGVIDAMGVAVNG
jgi:hypothetical protein